MSKDPKDYSSLFEGYGTPEQDYGAIPYEKYRVTSKLGAPRPDGRTHNAADLVPEGTDDILNPYEGRVTRVENQPDGAGQWVEVMHGFDKNGQPVTSRRMHFSSIGVKVGDRVTRGQSLGKMGMTGRATGPHDHLEIRVGGKPVDPLSYRFSGLRAEATEPAAAPQVSDFSDIVRRAESAPRPAPEIAPRRPRPGETYLNPKSVAGATAASLNRASNLSQSAMDGGQIPADVLRPQVYETRSTGIKPPDALADLSPPGGMYGPETRAEFPGIERAGQKSVTRRTRRQTLGATGQVSDGTALEEAAPPAAPPAPPLAEGLQRAGAASPESDRRTMPPLGQPFDPDGAYPPTTPPRVAPSQDPRIGRPAGEPFDPDGAYPPTSAPVTGPAPTPPAVAPAIQDPRAGRPAGEPFDPDGAYPPTTPVEDRRTRPPLGQPFDPDGAYSPGPLAPGARGESPEDLLARLYANGYRQSSGLTRISTGPGEEQMPVPRESIKYSDPDVGLLSEVRSKEKVRFGPKDLDIQGGGVLGDVAGFANRLMSGEDPMQREGVVERAVPPKEGRSSSATKLISDPEMTSEGRVMRHLRIPIPRDPRYVTTDLINQQVMKLGGAGTTDADYELLKAKGLLPDFVLFKDADGNPVRVADGELQTLLAEAKRNQIEDAYTFKALSDAEKEGTLDDDGRLLLSDLRSRRGIGYATLPTGEEIGMIDAGGNLRYAIDEDTWNRMGGIKELLPRLTQEPYAPEEILANVPLRAAESFAERSGLPEFRSALTAAEEGRYGEAAGEALSGIRKGSGAATPFDIATRAASSLSTGIEETAADVPPGAIPALENNLTRGLLSTPGGAIEGLTLGQIEGVRLDPLRDKPGAVAAMLLPELGQALAETPWWFIPGGGAPGALGKTGKGLIGAGETVADAAKLKRAAQFLNYAERRIPELGTMIEQHPMLAQSLRLAATGGTIEALKGQQPGETFGQYVRRVGAQTVTLGLIPPLMKAVPSTFIGRGGRTVHMPQNLREEIAAVMASGLVQIATGGESQRYQFVEDPATNFALNTFFDVVSGWATEGGVERAMFGRRRPIVVQFSPSGALNTRQGADTQSMYGIYDPEERRYEQVDPEYAAQLTEQGAKTYPTRSREAFNALFPHGEMGTQTDKTRAARSIFEKTVHGGPITPDDPDLSPGMDAFEKADFLRPAPDADPIVSREPEKTIVPPPPQDSEFFEASVEPGADPGRVRGTELPPASTPRGLPPKPTIPLGPSNLVPAERAPNRLALPSAPREHSGVTIAQAREELTRAGFESVAEAREAIAANDPRADALSPEVRELILPTEHRPTSRPTGADAQPGVGDDETEETPTSTTPASTAAVDGEAPEGVVPSGAEDSSGPGTVEGETGPEAPPAPKRVTEGSRFATRDADIVDGQVRDGRSRWQELVNQGMSPEEATNTEIREAEESGRAVLEGMEDGEVLETAGGSHWIRDGNELRPYDAETGEVGDSMLGPIYKGAVRRGEDGKPLKDTNGRWVRDYKFDPDHNVIFEAASSRNIGKPTPKAGAPKAPGPEVPPASGRIRIPRGTPYTPERPAGLPDAPPLDRDRLMTGEEDTAVRALRRHLVEQGMHAKDAAERSIEHVMRVTQANELMALADDEYGPLADYFTRAGYYDEGVNPQPQHWYASEFSGIQPDEAFGITGMVSGGAPVVHRQPNAADRWTEPVLGPDGRDTGWRSTTDDYRNGASIYNPNNDKILRWLDNPARARESAMEFAAAHPIRKEDPGVQHGESSSRGRTGTSTDQEGDRGEGARGGATRAPSGTVPDVEGASDSAGDDAADDGAPTVQPDQREARDAKDLAGENASDYESWLTKNEWGDYVVSPGHSLDELQAAHDFYDNRYRSAMVKNADDRLKRSAFKKAIEAAKETRATTPDGPAAGLLKALRNYGESATPNVDVWVAIKEMAVAGMSDAEILAAVSDEDDKRLIRQLMKENRQVLDKIRSGDKTTTSTPAPNTARDTDTSEGPTFTDVEGVVPGTAELIRVLWNRFMNNEAIKDNPALTKLADAAFKGTRASGTYTPRDMYDALEVAMNEYVRSTLAATGMDAATAEAAARIWDDLAAALAMLPRQTDRTEEQKEFQQFSTPPPLAYLVGWVANPSSADVVLEPSAGTGSLAMWPRTVGASVHTNEITPRRRALLEMQGYPTTEANGEFINATLDRSIRPTLIVMNPPFSATGGRVKTHDPKYGARHIKSALERLEPGGRLVAISSESFAIGRPKMANWWAGIIENYNVRAVLTLPGEEYAKYGTTYGNTIIVIDKTGPTPGATHLERLNNIIHGGVDSQKEAFDVLEPIRQDREAPADASGDSDPNVVPPPGTNTGGTRRGGSSGTRGRRPTPGDRTRPGAGTDAQDQVGSGDSDVQADQSGDQSQPNPDDAALPDSTRDAEDAQTPDAVKAPPHPRNLTYSEHYGTAGPPMAKPERGLSAAEHAQASLRATAFGGTWNASRQGWEFPDSDALRSFVEGAVATVSAPTPTPTPTPTPPPTPPPPRPAPRPVDVEEERAQGATFLSADVSKVTEAYPNAKPHPAKLVESAAMASVETPPVTYRTSLPESVISEGRISDVQLERVLYAGQRHATELPDGSIGGYFVGDGTGVGKGRIVSAIIADNWMQGRKRAVWFTVNYDLVDSTARDLRDIGFHDTIERDPKRPRNIISRTPAEHDHIPLGILNDTKADADISLENGVLFASYSGLTSRSKAGRRRIDQIAEWLGEDGVIIFDEAHKAKNAVAGPQGKASQMGLAVVEIQTLLPKARVVYASATGATEVRNMGYMTRLGLWGDKTPFPEFSNFEADINAGGVGAMEIVSREMKQLGMYGGVTISYEGVEYDEVEHTLTADQLDQYNAAARAFQLIFSEIENAITATNASPRAKGMAMQAYFGGQQRIMKMILTAMKLPTAIKEVEKALADDKSVILSLLGTGESRTGAKVGEALAEGNSLDDLDFSPRDAIGAMVEAAFPTVIYVETTNASGEPVKVPLTDAEGNPVVDPAMVAKRAEIIENLKRLRLPDNPLDMIISHFGHDKVAEMTGREKRLMRDPRTGEMAYVKRADAGSKERVNIAEMRAFQDGRKRIAVISAASSTGISLHADLNAKNQQQRVQITLELGWSADQQMQTFGRSHRSNQAQPPRYVLLRSNVEGEKRFISTIARRLSSLGALTRGQQDASGASADISQYNFESVYGQAAVSQTYANLERGMYGGWQTMIDMAVIRPLPNNPSLTTQLSQSDRNNVTRFLNRLLMLDVERQNELFEGFMDQFERAVQQAKDNGTFDSGVTDIRAMSIEEVNPPVVVREDEKTGAKTTYHELKVKTATHPVEFARALEMKNSRPDFAGESPRFAVQKKSGRIVLVVPTGTTTTGRGAVEVKYRAYRPSGISFTLKQEDLEKYDKVDVPQARPVWQAEFDADPGFTEDATHIIGGSILPIWGRLQTGRGQSLRIVRVITDDGKRIIGVEIPSTIISYVLRQIGVSRKMADPAVVHAAVLNDGERVELVGGLFLKRIRFKGDFAIELVNLPWRLRRQFAAWGGITEEIKYADHYFIPNDPARGVPVLEELFDQHPPMAAGDTGDDDGPSAELAWSEPHPDTPADSPYFENISSPEANFKEWFAGSDIVDEHGNPLRLNHGSNKAFATFREDVGSHASPHGAQAVWFSDGTRIPNMAHETPDGKGYADGAQVYPVFVRSTNTFDYRNPTHVQSLARALGTTPEERATWEKELARGDYDVIERPAPQAALRRLGFTGFWSEYTFEDGYTERFVGVFKGRDAKSIFNRGTWSGAEDDMSAERSPLPAVRPVFAERLPKTGAAPLIASLQRVLTPDLLKPEQRERLAPGDHRATGHSYAAAEASWHLLGGASSPWKPVCISLPEEQNTHWYLEHEKTGAKFDPTAEQFGKAGPPYERGVRKGFLTKEPSRRARRIIERVAIRETGASLELIPEPTGGHLVTTTSGAVIGHTKAVDPRQAIADARRMVSVQNRRPGVDVSLHKDAKGTVAYRAPRTEFEAPVVFVDKTTANIITTLASNFESEQWTGLSYDAAAHQMTTLIDVLEMWVADANGPQQRKLAALLAAVERARSDALAGIGSITFAVLPEKMDDYGKLRLAETIAHEQSHAIQHYLSRLFTKGRSSQHFIPAEFRRVLEASPIYQKVVAELERRGYNVAHPKMAMEIFAHLIASSNVKPLGVTTDEAVELLALFFDAIHETHGADAVEMFTPTTPAARRARTKYHEARQGQETALPNDARGAAARGIALSSVPEGKIGPEGSLEEGVRDDGPDAALFSRKKPVAADPKMDNVRKAQGEYLSPPMRKRLEEKLESAAKLKRDVGQLVLNRFAQTDKAVRKAIDRTGPLSVLDNPTVQNAIAFGGTAGVVEAAMLEYADVEREARRAGLSEHLERLLNYDGFERAWQTVRERRQEQVDRVTRHMVQHLPVDAFIRLHEMRWRERTASGYVDRGPILPLVELADILRVKSQGGVLRDQTKDVLMTLPNAKEALKKLTGGRKIGSTDPVWRAKENYAMEMIRLVPNAVWIELNKTYSPGRKGMALSDAELKELLGWKTVVRGPLSRGLVNTIYNFKLKAFGKHAGQAKTDIITHRQFQRITDLHDAAHHLIGSNMFAGTRHHQMVAIGTYQQWADTWDDAQARIEAIDEKIRTKSVVPERYDEIEIDTMRSDLLDALDPADRKRLEDLAARIYGLNRRMLDIALAEGLVTPAGYQRFTARGDKYVPLNRIFEDRPEDDRRRTTGGGDPLFVRMQQIIKELAGSERVNIPPVLASMAHAAETLREAARNRAASTLIRLGDRDALFGMLIRPLAFGEQAGTGEGEIIVYENGKRMRYAIPEEIAEEMELATAKQVELIGGSIIGWVNHVFKAGATGMNLAFALPNMARDLRDYFRYAESAPRYWNPVDYPVAIFDYFASLYHTVLHDKAYRDVLGAGALWGTLQKQITPEFFLRPFHDRFLRSPLKTAAKIALFPYPLTARIVNTLEETTKVMAYRRALRKALKRGFSHLEAQYFAAYEARTFGGSPDFAIQGGAAKQIAMVIPFFPAALAGIRRTVRWWQGRDQVMPGARGGVANAAGGGNSGGIYGKAFQAAGGGRRGRALIAGLRGLAQLIAAVLAGFAYYEWQIAPNADEWEKRPEWERFRSWQFFSEETEMPDGERRKFPFNFPMSHHDQFIIPTVVHLIHKARGGNVNFGQLAEHQLSIFSPVNIDRSKETEPYGRAVVRSTISSTTPILKVPFELGANWDTFRDQALEWPWMLKVDPVYRYSAGMTSPTVRKVAEAAERIKQKLGLRPDVDVVVNNPVKLQHLIGGIVAGSSETALSAVDAATNKVTSGSWFGDDRSVLRPDEKVRRIPLVGPLVRRFIGSTIDANEKNALDRFYDNYKSSASADQTFRRLGQHESAEAAKEFMDRPENFTRAAFSKELEELVGLQAGIRSQYNKIARDPDIADADKRLRLSTLRDGEKRLIERAERIDQLMRSGDLNQILRDETALVYQHNLKVDVFNFQNLQKMRAIPAFKRLDPTAQKAAEERLTRALSPYRRQPLSMADPDKVADQIVDDLERDIEFIVVQATGMIERDGKAVDLIDYAMRQEF